MTQSIIHFIPWIGDVKCTKDFADFRTPASGRQHHQIVALLLSAMDSYILPCDNVDE